jgi:hypothetical protein
MVQLKKKPDCEFCIRAYEINHELYQPMARIMGLVDLILMAYERGDFEEMKQLRKLMDPENEELRKRVNNLFFIK